MVLCCSITRFQTSFLIAFVIPSSLRYFSTSSQTLTALSLQVCAKGSTATLTCTRAGELIVAVGAPDSDVTTVVERIDNRLLCQALIGYYVGR
jgi:hypothetical protein